MSPFKGLVYVGSMARLAFRRSVAFFFWANHCELNGLRDGERQEFLLRTLYLLFQHIQPLSSRDEKYEEKWKIKIFGYLISGTGLHILKFNLHRIFTGS